LPKKGLPHEITIVIKSGIGASAPHRNERWGGGGGGPGGSASIRRCLLLTNVRRIGAVDPTKPGWRGNAAQILLYFCVKGKHGHITTNMTL
jgi:hypothetical protein